MREDLLLEAERLFRLTDFLRRRRLDLFDRERLDRLECTDLDERELLDKLDRLDRFDLEDLPDLADLSERAERKVRVERAEFISLLLAERNLRSSEPLSINISRRLV